MSDYLSYLQRRHPLSYPYRQHLLYPAYRRWLPGDGIEIGCGLGEFLERTPRFIGIDPDPAIVAAAARKGLRVCAGSAEAVPFRDGSFDAALLDNVVEHLHDVAAAFAEVLRVLRPGGRLLVVVPNRLGYARDPTHVRYWDEDNLPQALGAAGFCILRMAHFPIPSKTVGNRFWPYNTFVALAAKPASGEGSYR